MRHHALSVPALNDEMSFVAYQAPAALAHEYLLKMLRYSRIILLQYVSVQLALSAAIDAQYPLVIVERIAQLMVQSIFHLLHLKFWRMQALILVSLQYVRHVDLLSVKAVILVVNESHHRTSLLNV